MVNGGTEHHDEKQGDGAAHQHIGGGVDTQIQPGQGDQEAQRHRDQPQPELLALGGQNAEGAHGAGGMAGGEGIAGGLRPGGFDDGEVGIPHPGTGDPAGDLQKLVDQGTHKAHTHQIIALALIHAPEDRQRGNEEHGLTAQVGQGRHDGIQPGSAKRLQHI